MNLPLPDRLDTFAIILLDESIVYQDTSRNENKKWKEKDNTKAVVIILFAGLFFLYYYFQRTIGWDLFVQVCLI